MFNTSSNNDFIFNSEAVDVNLLNGSKLGGVDSEVTIFFTKSDDVKLRPILLNTVFVTPCAAFIC